MRALVLILALAVSPAGAVVCELACAPPAASQSSDASHAHHHGPAEPATPTTPATTDATNVTAADSVLSAPSSRCELATPALVSVRLTSTDRTPLTHSAWLPTQTPQVLLRAIGTVLGAPPGLPPPFPVRSNLQLRL